MNEPSAARPSWARFAAAVACGLVLAFIVFAGLLGDCTGPDGSPAMRACIASRQSVFWLFPALLLAALAAAAWLQRRGSRWGMALALAGAMIAGEATMGIEWLIA